jgi:predicted HTH transcriptional regulator
MPGEEMTKGKKKGEASEAREKMWKVMRGLGKFTNNDVATLIELNSGSVGTYITMLKNAGYVRTDGKEKAKTSPRTIYRLIKNTGAKAPYEKKMVYDPNLSEVKSVD